MEYSFDFVLIFLVYFFPFQQRSTERWQSRRRLPYEETSGNWVYSLYTLYSFLLSKDNIFKTVKRVDRKFFMKNFGAISAFDKHVFIFGSTLNVRNRQYEAEVWAVWVNVWYILGLQWFCNIPFDLSGQYPRYTKSVWQSRIWNYAMCN